MMPGSVFHRTNVVLRLVCCRSRDKAALLLERLDAERPAGTVFVRTKDDRAANAAVDLLRERGFEARLVSPGMNADAVLRTLAWFRTAERAALAAVEGVAAPERGDIRQVFVMNLPASLHAVLPDLEAAGRDGLLAEAVVFASLGDIDMRLSSAGDAESRGRMRQAVRWMENDGCARRFLSRALYGRDGGDCGNCGWCIGRAARFLPWE